MVGEVEHRTHVRPETTESAELTFPDNDPAYIEIMRETFQMQGIHDDTRAEILTQLLAEDY